MNAEPGHPHFTPRETHRQSRLQVQCGHPRVILSFEKKNNLDQHFIASLTVCCAPEHADVTQWVSAAHNGCDSSTSRRVRSQQTLHTFSIKETNRSLAFSAHGTRPQLRRQSRNPKNYSLARIFFFWSEHFVLRGGGNERTTTVRRPCEEGDDRATIAN